MSRPKFKGSKARFALAAKEGSRKTIFTMKPNKQYFLNQKLHNSNENEFPFVPGSSFKGEWKSNMKNGFGTMTYNNGNIYEGEWVDNKREGKGSMYVKDGKKTRKQYSGDWVAGKMEGLGVFISANGDTYEGSWLNNKKHGKGRMIYSNGEGERSGRGVLTVENGDRFEGNFSGDAKEGPGKFFYFSTNKMYEGEWVKGTPKCGEFKSVPSHLQKSQSNTIETFELPNLTLQDPQSVLSSAVAEIRQSRVQNASSRGDSSNSVVFNEADVEQMKLAFNAFATDGLMVVRDLGDVVKSLGIMLQENQLDMLLSHLDAEDDDEINYAEFVDIIMVVTGADM